jgi:hypothetical protein
MRGAQVKSQPDLGWLHPHGGALLLVTVSTGTSSSGRRTFPPLPAAEYPFPEQGYKKADSGAHCCKANRADNIIAENIQQRDQERAADRAGFRVIAIVHC